MFLKMSRKSLEDFDRKEQNMNIESRINRIASAICRTASGKGTVTIIHEYVTDESAKHGDIDESLTETEDHAGLTWKQAVGLLLDNGLTVSSGGDTYYSEDSHQDPYSGDYESLSAGLKGFTSEEEDKIEEAVENGGKTYEEERLDEAEEELSKLLHKPLIEAPDGSDYLYLIYEREDEETLWLGCGEPLGNAGLLKMEYKIKYDTAGSVDSNLQGLIEEVEDKNPDWNRDM